MLVVTMPRKLFRLRLDSFKGSSKKRGEFYVFCVSHNPFRCNKKNVKTAGRERVVPP